MAYGIRPASVIGHSCGEIAAAYAAGAFDMGTAIIISYYRGQVVKSSKEGAMAAIGLSSQDVQPFLEEGVVAACQNSPKSTTISGDVDKVEQILERIRAEQPEVFCRRLKVSVAYHSGRLLSFDGSGLCLTTLLQVICVNWDSCMRTLLSHIYSYIRRCSQCTPL